MLKYFRYSTSKEIQIFVYNGRNLSPVWFRMNAAWYFWWSTHKPTTVSPAYHPMKEHPTTLTIIVTFAFKILVWLLLVLCSHSWPAERDIPWRAALLQKAPADTSQTGCQGAKMIEVNQPPLWWSMSHFFLFRAISRDLGLENSFFLGRQR